MFHENNFFNKFNKSLNNLRSLNLFKSVDSKMTDNIDPNLKSINIIVEEKPTGDLERELKLWVRKKKKS